jgi:hypothetical protein
MRLPDIDPDNFWASVKRRGDVLADLMEERLADERWARWELEEQQ